MQLNVDGTKWGPHILITSRAQNSDQQSRSRKIFGSVLGREMELRQKSSLNLPLQSKAPLQRENSKIKYLTNSELHPKLKEAFDFAVLDLAAQIMCLHGCVSPRFLTYTHTVCTYSYSYINKLNNLKFLN